MTNFNFHHHQIHSRLNQQHGTPQTRLRFHILLVSAELHPAISSPRNRSAASPWPQPSTCSPALICLIRRDRPPVNLVSAMDVSNRASSFPCIHANIDAVPCMRACRESANSEPEPSISFFRPSVPNLPCFQSDSHEDAPSGAAPAEAVSVSVLLLSPRNLVCGSCCL